MKVKQVILCEYCSSELRTNDDGFILKGTLTSVHNDHEIVSNTDIGICLTCITKKLGVHWTHIAYR